MGNFLVSDITTSVIDNIWRTLPMPPHYMPQNVTKQVMPLRTFVSEILKRSQTSYATLQLALSYLFQIRMAVITYVTKRHAAGWSKPTLKDDYICCGRRMFLASLIVASKYLHDKTFRNLVWATIARVTVHEVNVAEGIFLTLIEYKLYTPPNAFHNLHNLMCRQAQALLRDTQLISSLLDIQFGFSPHHHHHHQLYLMKIPHHHHHHRIIPMYHHHCLCRNNNCHTGYKRKRTDEDPASCSRVVMHPALPHPPAAAPHVPSFKRPRTPTTTQDDWTTMIKT